MIKAEPAIVPGPVKAGTAPTRRAKFPRLGAARAIAIPFAIADPSMKAILFHGFHMAMDWLEWKP